MSFFLRRTEHIAYSWSLYEGNILQLDSQDWAFPKDPEKDWDSLQVHAFLWRRGQEYWIGNSLILSFLLQSLCPTTTIQNVRYLNSGFTLWGLRWSPYSTCQGLHQLCGAYILLSVSDILFAIALVCCLKVSDTVFDLAEASSISLLTLVPSCKPQRPFSTVFNLSGASSGKFA